MLEHLGAAVEALDVEPGRRLGGRLHKITKRRRRVLRQRLMIAAQGLEDLVDPLDAVLPVEPDHGVVGKVVTFLAQLIEEFVVGPFLGDHRFSSR